MVEFVNSVKYQNGEIGYLLFCKEL